MDQKRFIRKTFNDEFIKFITEVRTIFPEDKDVKKGVSALELLKKANPKLIIEIWKQYIVDVYATQIENGELDYFLDKDYQNDVSDSGNASEILTSINRLRQPIRNMGEKNKETSMQYIQQLTKLCQLYFS